MEISEIWKFPVKSFAGHRVQSAQLGPLGIEGDRRWALRNVETGHILSAKRPKIGRLLLTCSARLNDEGLPIVSIGESEFSLDNADELNSAFSELLGQTVCLVPATGSEEIYESYWPELEGMALSDTEANFPIALATENGTFVDLAALHLISTSSLSHLRQLDTDLEIDSRRFRPSIVVDTGDSGGFMENDWVDRTAKIGEATIKFGPASPRCVMTTLGQDDLGEQPQVLRTLAKHNRQTMEGFGDFACLGIYAEVVEPGLITEKAELSFL